MKAPKNPTYFTVTQLAAVLVFSVYTASAQTAASEAPDIATTVTTTQAPKATQGVEGPNAATYWGAGVGLVFSSIPVSSAEFVSPFTQLYYSWYVTDPNESFRTALSMGLYGFGMILPVPKVSAEMLIGKPTQDVQGKLGVGGFYDISVGGHGGIALETGVRLANRYDVSFIMVPAGTDSKRDYLDFMGLREDGDVAEKPFVIMPYYGVFLSVAIW
jgi:hypothetical protein